MEKLKKQHHNTLKNVLLAINFYSKYKLTKIKEVLVLSYFCTFGISNATDAFIGLGRSFDRKEFDSIIEHLLELKLIYQVNKRGRHKMYACTDSGNKLYRMMIFM